MKLPLTNIDKWDKEDVGYFLMYPTPKEQTHNKPIREGLMIALDGSITTHYYMKLPMQNTEGIEIIYDGNPFDLTYL